MCVKHGARCIKKLLTKYELLILCIFLLGFFNLTETRGKFQEFKKIQISPWCLLGKFSREKTGDKT